MLNKSDILNNLKEYTADQVAEAIMAGKVTIYELSKTGNLTPLMRRRIEERLAAKTTEASPSAPKVAPTIEDAPSLNLDSSENTEISEAVDTDYPSEIIISEAPFITATQSFIFEPTKREELLSTNNSLKSNKGMFKRPFSFEGRIRRTELWLSILLVYSYAFLVGFILGYAKCNLGIVEIHLILIPGYWLLWAQNAKRCHDRGNSGWYQLIPFYAIVLLFGESDKGSNEYGDNPKE